MSNVHNGAVQMHQPGRQDDLTTDFDGVGLVSVDEFDGGGLRLTGDLLGRDATDEGIDCYSQVLAVLCRDVECLRDGKPRAQLLCS